MSPQVEVEEDLLVVMDHDCYDSQDGELLSRYVRDKEFRVEEDVPYLLRCPAN